MTLTLEESAMAATQDDIAVRCRGVTKVYRTGGTEVHALRGIDLDVPTGELMMVLDPASHTVGRSAPLKTSKSANAARAGSVSALMPSA